MKSHRWSRLSVETFLTMYYDNDTCARDIIDYLRLSCNKQGLKYFIFGIGTRPLQILESIFWTLDTDSSMNVNFKRDWLEHFWIKWWLQKQEGYNRERENVKITSISSCKLCWLTWQYVLISIQHELAQQIQKDAKHPRRSPMYISSMNCNKPKRILSLNSFCFDFVYHFVQVDSQYLILF